MNFAFNTLRDRIHKNAAYHRTLSELNALPLEIKLDLDIAGIEDKVARRAVYGRAV
ncbi:hypothetical protein ACOXXX_00690 [Thalassococcus sp. BH17M4-6]|uniref:hypothetical protein n=1 Tax=Thalassococcus sp. BH17M4-6 TaxID=3413148 RepID=UPI003BC18B09